MIRMLSTPSGPYLLTKLRGEATAAFPKLLDCNEINNGAQIGFYWENPADAPTQSALDAVMAAHDPTPPPLSSDLLDLRKYMPVSGSPAAAAVTAYIGDNTNPLAIRATMLAMRAIIRLLFREATS